MGSAYHRVARLGTHPAFSMRLACLVCPRCGEQFGRVPAYTKHFLAHDPTLEEAQQWLDWRAYDRFAARAVAAVNARGLTYVWRWRTVADPHRPPGAPRIPHPLAPRFGSRCRSLCRGPNGNVLIEFEADGYRTVAPRHAIRKAT